jgi:16S rRNA (cytosine967-C5)-methyltransferase
MTNVRLAAARALLSIDNREATLGGVLDAAHQQIDAVRDRALMLEITVGALRWRNQLDALIASASRRSVRDIDPRALAVLRLATYQLRHLDRVPAHAVVHESVHVARALGAESAAGFVNAVLRAMVRRGPALALPARPGPASHRDAQVSYLSVTLSHPAWLVRRWIDRMGFDAAEAWCRFNNTPPDVTVRAFEGGPVEDLLERLHAENIAAVRAPFVTDALRLPPGALGRISPELRLQLWAQDEAAQLVARAAFVQPEERVLDLCAAPGGKTLVLASDLQLRDEAQRGQLVAADGRPGRVRMLKETIAQAHVPASVVLLDGREPLPFAPVFDCVVVDAPCSGLGTLRREPDLKWTRTPDDMAPLAADQLRLLAAAAEVVRPGGRVLYATCSSEPEENVDVITRFLDADRRFAPGMGKFLEGIPPAVLDERGHMVTRPDRHALEAFFAAVLVRQTGT